MAIRSIHHQITHSPLAYPFWQPIVRAVGLLAGAVILFLWLIGGLFFWTPQLAGVFVIGEANENPSNLELAQSGIKNIKRMVGEGDAWSYTIQREYNSLFAGQSNPLFNQTYASINDDGTVQPNQPPGSYNANFVQPTHSPITPTVSPAPRRVARPVIN